jgi:IS1 family transposase
MERASRFVVAHSSGPREAGLVDQVVQTTQQRTNGQAFAWCSDGWAAYATVLHQRYRQPQRHGRRGRPRLEVPADLRLTQTVKQRDAHGRLVKVETRATLGPAVTPAGTQHEERLNGSLRDRLNALTRKTHAFAKRPTTWDALFTLALFEHDWLRAHPAMRLPIAHPTRRYQHRSPAMAVGLTDHIWSWDEFLMLPVYVVRSLTS